MTSFTATIPTLAIRSGGCNHGYTPRITKIIHYDQQYDNVTTHIDTMFKLQRSKEYTHMHTLHNASIRPGSSSITSGTSTAHTCTHTYSPTLYYTARAGASGGDSPSGGTASDCARCSGRGGERCRSICARFGPAPGTGGGRRARCAGEP